MPHLTTTGTARRTSGGEQLGFGVPGYAHPLLAPVEWAELTRPGTPLHWAVLNIDNGPGGRPDPHCLEAAGRLRNARERALRGEAPDDTVRAAGGRLLGHLDLAGGTGPSTRSSPTPGPSWPGTGSAASTSTGAPPSAPISPPSGGSSPRSPRSSRTATTRTAAAGSSWGTTPIRTRAMPRRPTSSSPSGARGPTTAGRRWRSGPPPTRPAVSRTSCTASRAPTWTRPCASPAGRARGRSSSRTGRPGPKKGDKSIHSRRCPVTGTKLSRGSDLVSRNERGRGSVTARTTVRSRST